MPRGCTSTIQSLPPAWHRVWLADDVQVMPHIVIRLLRTSSLTGWLGAKFGRLLRESHLSPHRGVGRRASKFMLITRA